MLSLKFIREKSELVKTSLSGKNTSVDIDALLQLDATRRSDLQEVEQLRAEKNRVSGDIAEKKKDGENAEADIIAMREVAAEIKSVEERLKTTEEQIQSQIYFIPNYIHESVPRGKTENDNVVVREWGDKPEFDFAPKDHVELGKSLGLLDFKGAVKMAGSGFPLYTGLGAKLERSLINFMLDFHIQHHGYLELFPPFLAQRNAMQNTGQLPKFEEDMYRIPEDGLYCIPTAEVPVTNIHQGEILSEDELPKKYAAYSACFRREAGSYGKDTKGLTRLHQFNKVELVKFTHPQHSYAELESLVENAEAVLQALGLHYRIIELCSGDLSFSAAKCYDIEVWSPAEGKYLEVSSCSNFENFQARRAEIRFRNKETGKAELLHTLNGSGVATPRLMIALLETGQQENGFIKLPEALHPYMQQEKLIP
ncbi:MAG: serine--tRNA ligase [Candidatus Marinimicrobia bacterium]|nr:serine--tRNA ligase [Candidatus Neomarinimicrobiota bacterium]